MRTPAQDGVDGALLPEGPVDARDGIPLNLLALRHLDRFAFRRLQPVLDGEGSDGETLLVADNGEDGAVNFVVGRSCEMKPSIILFSLFPLAPS